jgi:hypothetical protein
MILRHHEDMNGGGRIGVPKGHCQVVLINLLRREFAPYYPAKNAANIQTFHTILPPEVDLSGVRVGL